jgi:AraC-like DNA-binding protein
MDKKIPTESLLQFYERTGAEVPHDLKVACAKGHFNVKSNKTTTAKSPFNRRDYYKICLTTGDHLTGTILYNDQHIPLTPPCLLFTNPSVPASIEITAVSAERQYCLFDKKFIEGCITPDIQYACSLFNPSLHPVVKLTTEEVDRLKGYFNDMQMLQQSDYPFKWDMVRIILQLLIHEGIRLQQKQFIQPVIVRDRLVNDFFAMLNKQFPVDSPESSLKLLTPSHFAELLHVHVNHLNSMVKRSTGNTTSSIIRERMIAEARALLRNTNWNIAEIAFALGFEYPSHFNKYFKQFTGLAPMEFRTGNTPVPAAHL